MFPYFLLLKDNSSVFTNENNYSATVGANELSCWLIISRAIALAIALILGEAFILYLLNDIALLTSDASSYVV